MPGAVIAVHVTDGDAVEAGQPVLVLEAMKMEHTLTAPIAGTVRLDCAVGDQVGGDRLLAVVDPHPDQPEEPDGAAAQTSADPTD